jgi:hypothetical protein
MIGPVMAQKAKLVTMAGMPWPSSVKRAGSEVTHW